MDRVSKHPGVAIGVRNRVVSFVGSGSGLQDAFKMSRLNAEFRTHIIDQGRADSTRMTHGTRRDESSFDVCF